ncbi:hypothetical protein SWZG_00287 [Synechococcus phage S-SKS1]|uniref:Uncharacterized protein n=1 Tax=Synechococcus phage S-SKS1 TaxID=754042 RepID=M4QQ43_9CAUD|nr:hypothetical protein SWZG_00287 [Synechococcus phage S-SKS1]AGH31790.1 hypothetical protein SWZG_00287 [Synechococcus phage S-SKS1]
MAIFSLNEVRTEQIKNIANDNFESWPESATYGYFGGGFFTPPSTYLDTIDRIDFSNETASAPGNNLPEARSQLAAVSSSSYGYFGGGFAPPNVSTIERLDFSNETLSLPGGDLPEARASLAGTSSNSYGYFAGGQAPSLVPAFRTTIDRIDFSNETRSAAAENLPAKN